MVRPESDADELLSHAVSSAERLLAKFGEFFPFGVGRTPGGDFAQIYTHSEREQPPSDEVLEELLVALRRAAGEGIYVATAIVYDVKLELADAAEGNAVIVSVDCRSGFSADVLFAYSVERGEVRFDEGRRYANEMRVFEALG